MNELEMLLGQVYSGGGSGGGGTGTTNYNALTNKPQIGGEVLSGDKKLGKFGELQDLFDEKSTQAVALTTSMPTLTMTKGSDSVKVTADTVEVKNGADSVTATKDSVKVADVSDSVTATKTQVEVKNGTDITTIKKNEIKATDGTDTMTATPLKVEVKDADETATVAKDSVEVKKGAVITKIEDDRASMTDGTHTIAMSPVKATYGEHLKLDGDGVLESWEKVLGVGNFAVIEKTTVSKAYAVGSYLLSGGTMYRVTKAISSGGTITTTGANANVEAKRVDEVIAELTAKDTAQDTEIAALSNSGAKNILNPNGNAVQTQFGVTFTRNADGSITVSGTATDRAQYTVGTFNLAEGSYRLTGAPSGASQTTHALYERVHPYAAGVALNYDEGSGKNFTVTSATAGTHAVIIDVKSGQTLDNVVYYPMVRDAAITDDTYVPYAMSNAELTAKKQDVGDYVLNGGATGYADFKFSKSAHVQNMRRGNNQYSNGLSILGENSKADLDGVIREWLRYERHTGQLQGYIYKEGASSWEAVHSWQADEDTGWQTLETDTTKWTGGELRYRKKNGIVFVTMNDGKPAANITGGQHIQIATLPTGSRPTWASQYGALWLRTASGNIPCEFVVATTGAVFVRPSQAVTATNITSSYGSVSFPV